MGLQSKKQIITTACEDLKDRNLAHCGENEKWSSHIYEKSLGVSQNLYMEIPWDPANLPLEIQEKRKQV